MRQYPLRRRLARCTSLGLIPVLVNPVPPQFTPTGGQNFLSPHGDLKGRIRSVRVILQVPATAGTSAAARRRQKAASSNSIPRRFRPPGRYSNPTPPESRHVGVPATAGTSATARSRQKAASSPPYPVDSGHPAGTPTPRFRNHVQLEYRPRGPESTAGPAEPGSGIRRCFHPQVPASEVPGSR